MIDDSADLAIVNGSRLLIDGEYDMVLVFPGPTAVTPLRDPSPWPLYADHTHRANDRPTS